MSVRRTVGIILFTLLTVTLALNTGCNVGGANIRLEGVVSGNDNDGWEARRRASC